MTLYDLAALAAAFSIALSNLIAPGAVRHLGPVVFNSCRLAAALAVVLGLVAMPDWRRCDRERILTGEARLPRQRVGSMEPRGAARRHAEGRDHGALP